MDYKRDIREAVSKLSGTFNTDVVALVDCTVDSVNLTEQTCDCTPVSGRATTSIPSVELKAEPNNGILIVPKVGSSVKVALTKRGNAFVVLFSDIDKMEIAISNGTQDTLLTISQGVIKFNDGSFDGLVKVSDLVTKLNTLESDLNTLKAAFTAWVVVPNDGGAALKAASATWAGQTLTPTVNADIENPLVTHGN